MTRPAMPHLRCSPLTRRWIAQLSVPVFIGGCSAASAPPASPPVVDLDASEPRPGPDRSRLPEPGPAPRWQAPQPQILRLSNGLPVYYVQDDAVPLATLKLVLPHGSGTDPEGAHGLTALMVDLLDEGAAEQDALQLSDALTRLATEYSVHTDVDSVTLTIETLAEHFEASTRLLADIVRRPHLDAEEFERVRARRIAGLKAQQANPQHARQVVLHRVLFGHGYGGFPVNGTPESLRSVQLPDVKRHYRELVVPDRAALVLVGAVEAARAQSVLQAAFGDWEGRTNVANATMADHALQPAVHAVHFPGATQSSLAVARRGPGANDPELFANELFSRSFGGAFTSRVNLNLREDKGYTYGARSGFRRWKSAGVFQITTNVHSEVTREGLEEILGELTRVAEEQPITNNEYAEAVEGMLLGYPSRFERQQSVARQFVNLPLYARPLDWYTQWPRLLQGQSLERVHTAARQLSDPNDYVIVIAGDRSVIEAELQDWPRPITWYDAWGNPIAQEAAKPASD